MNTVSNPIKIFIVYSRRDDAYLRELQHYLKPLARQEEVEVWYDGEMMSGRLKLLLSTFC